MREQKIKWDEIMGESSFCGLRIQKCKTSTEFSIFAIFPAVKM